MWFHQKYRSALAMGFGGTQMSPCALRTFSTQATAPCRALQQTQHFPKDAKQLTYGTLPPHLPMQKPNILGFLSKVNQLRATGHPITLSEVPKTLQRNSYCQNPLGGQSLHVGTDR